MLLLAAVSGLAFPPAANAANRNATAQPVRERTRSNLIRHRQVLPDEIQRLWKRSRYEDAFWASELHLTRTYHQFSQWARPAVRRSAASAVKSNLRSSIFADIEKAFQLSVQPGSNIRSVAAVRPEKRFLYDGIAVYLDTLYWQTMQAKSKAEAQGANPYASLTSESASIAIVDPYALQRILQPGEAVLKIHLDRLRGGWVWFVTTEQFVAFQTEASAREIQAAVAEWMHTIQAGAHNGTDSTWRQSGKLLYDNLLAPLAEFLPAIDKLVLTANAGLADAPLMVLLHAGLDSLSVPLPIVYRASSVSAWYDLHVAGRVSTHIAPPTLFGAPRIQGRAIRYVRSSSELSRIHRMFPGSTVIAGQAADEASFVQQALAGANLYVDAPCVLAPETLPFASSIRLAPTDKLDGYFNAAEIARTNMQHPGLVFLGNCSVHFARDSERNTSALFLAESLRVAGVDAVLVRLWDIPDESRALFMSYYYDHVYLDGPAFALGIAQARMRGTETYSHPVHWAGYALYGGWE